jgi:hypothetical protein
VTDATNGITTILNMSAAIKQLTTLNYVKGAMRLLTGKGAAIAENAFAATTV